MNISYRQSDWNDFQEEEKDKRKTGAYQIHFRWYPDSIEKFFKMVYVSNGLLSNSAVNVVETITEDFPSFNTNSATMRSAEPMEDAEDIAKAMKDKYPILIDDYIVSEEAKELGSTDVDNFVAYKIYLLPPVRTATADFQDYMRDITREEQGSLAFRYRPEMGTLTLLDNPSISIEALGNIFTGDDRWQRTRLLAKDPMEGMRYIWRQMSSSPPDISQEGNVYTLYWKKKK